jgi:hypothetical protein
VIQILGIVHRPNFDLKRGFGGWTVLHLHVKNLLCLAQSIELDHISGDIDNGQYPEN